MSQTLFTHVPVLIPNNDTLATFVGWVERSTGSITWVGELPRDDAGRGAMANKMGFETFHDLRSVMKIYSGTAGEIADKVLDRPREPYSAILSKPLDEQEVIAREKWAWENKSGEQPRGLWILRHLHEEVPLQFRAAPTPLINKYRISDADKVELLRELLNER